MTQDQLIRDIQQYLITKGFSEARKGTLGEVIAEYISLNFIHKDAFEPMKVIKDDEKDPVKIKEALQQSFDNARLKLEPAPDTKVING